MTEEANLKGERYQRAIAVGLGAVSGAVIPGAAGIVAGAVLGPLLEPMAQRIWGELASDGKRRGGDVLASAVEAAQLSEEEFERLVSSTDRTRLLAGVALSAANRTTFEGKLRALGYSLACGLLASDNTAIDMEQLVLASINDIEGPQLCLLDLIVGFEPPGDNELHPRPVLIPDYSYSMPLYGGWYWGDREWSESQICIARPRLAPILESLIGTLERHGLVRWDDNSEETLEKLRQQYRSDAERAKIYGFEPPPEKTRHAPQGAEEPKLLPTELGEQVWIRFDDAGADVPDVWTSQEAGED